jgi:DHA1 family inner membrane transport protein
MSHHHFGPDLGDDTARREVGSQVWALIAVSVSSITPILAMPVIVGALQDHWGYSAATAGYVSSADLFGVFIGSVATSVGARRLHWRRYVATAMVLSAAFNVLSMLGPRPLWFAMVRLGAGLTSGSAYAASLALLSRTPDPTRSFALSVCAQVLCNSLVLATFPLAIEHGGLAAAFAAIAALCLATLPVTSTLPTTDRSPVGSITKHLAHLPREGYSAACLLCLLAVGCFYLTIGSYWAYCERIGLEAGLSPDRVHQLLSVGVLFSAAGCLLAPWFSRRMGLTAPLLFSLIILATALAMNAALPNAALFVISLGIVQVCWNFVDIFQLGALAELEPSGRAAALVPAAQGLALAMGPSAAAMVLELKLGYGGVLAFGSGASICAAAAATMARLLRASSATCPRSADGSTPAGTAPVACDAAPRADVND